MAETKKKLTVTRGLQGGKFTMLKNFRDDGPKFRAKMERMWKMYRTGAYSQAEVAAKFGVGRSMTAMILRCDKKAPKKATRTFTQGIAKLVAVLRKEVQHHNAAAKRKRARKK